MADRFFYENEDLLERNISDRYLDFIVQYHSDQEEFIEKYLIATPEFLNNRYAVLHAPIPESQPITLLDEYSYSFFPKIFTLLNTVSLESSGILRTQNQPVLNLNGQGVMLGFLDTGIEYTHPAFRNTDGTSRIVSIWDQTIQDGPQPAGFSYGTEYTQQQINEALASDNPLEIVPSTDTNGHGTFVAGVAAGSPDTDNNFTGAAPKSSIAVVKLKEAKDFLRKFFMISGTAPAFQENDLMMALNYLVSVARANRMPLVVCIGLGTNQGDHSGRASFSDMLEMTASSVDISAAVASGNEAGRSHHFYGTISAQGEYQDVEILVGSENSSFSAELWAQPPELYSISIRSPLGEIVPRIPARLEQNQVITFILEETVIYIDYEVVERRSGSQLILMRFQSPTPGIWTVRVFCDTYANGVYNIWLPITGLIPQDTVFLQPNPDITITSPSSSEYVVTSSAYNAYDNSLYINSSRGYTRLGAIKPDIAAPGVDVYGPALNARYTQQTGTSGSAAITAGSMALLQNWIMTRNNNRLYSNRELKNLLIRGATRSSNLLYPNREWGYGTLNVYQIFESLM